MAALAEGVLNLRGPAERLEAWLKLLKHLKPGDIDGVIDAFGRHDQEGRLFPDEWRVMMSSLGAVDGKGLMEWMVADGGGGGVDANMGRGMTAWALASPHEAVEWWNQLPESPFRDSIAGPLIAGIAEKDPEKAWACVGLFPEEERARFAGAFVKATLARGGVERAVKWLESLGGRGAEAPPEFGAAAVSAFIQDAANIEPARRAELLKNIVSEDWAVKSGAVLPVAGQYASSNGPGATEWAASLTALKMGKIPPISSRDTFSCPPPFSKSWRRTQREVWHISPPIPGFGCGGAEWNASITGPVRRTSRSCSRFRPRNSRSAFCLRP